ATNIQNITKALMSTIEPEKQRARLIDTFNTFIANILEKLPGFIGQTATQELFKKIEARLAKL
ncbi:MAG: hypothetical protein JRF32_10470, partial [Deltaproteobacteria bacterium]|nr:hypothetical protein [Deltaproteobacteria bacterium]